MVSYYDNEQSNMGNHSENYSENNTLLQRVMKFSIESIFLDFMFYGNI